MNALWVIGEIRISKKIVRLFAIFALITEFLLISRYFSKRGLRISPQKFITWYLYVYIYQLCGLLFLFSIRLSDQIVRLFTIFAVKQRRYLFQDLISRRGLRNSLRNFITWYYMYISVKFLLYNFIIKIYHFPHCNYQNHISLECPRPSHADWKPYSPFLILKLSIQILTALFYMCVRRSVHLDCEHGFPILLFSRIFFKFSSLGFYDQKAFFDILDEKDHLLVGEEVP